MSRRVRGIKILLTEMPATGLARLALISLLGEKLHCSLRILQIDSEINSPDRVTVTTDQGELK